MRLVTFFVLCFSCLHAQEAGEEEALSLRRIADFWQEGEYQIAKSQMEEFLASFSESPYSDTLRVALGDLYMREKNHTKALEYYTTVQTPDLFKRVFLSRMHCLYHMQWYATLADECEAFLKQGSESDSADTLQATYLLAISLYQQCLNTTQDPAALNALALRARPYFENLSTTNLSGEVAQAFAHLCCILKDYHHASKIYLDLSHQNPNAEEFLFQAALLQSKYDKNLAIETFNQIRSRNGALSKEAAYNQLVLFFDQGRFDEITRTKDEIFADVPADRLGIAHLFIGKSYLALKNFTDAATELNAFLDAASPSDSIRPALLHLTEAAYQAGDLKLLDQSVSRLQTLDPNDAELPKVLFSRAQLLKKEQKISEAKEQLASLLAKYPQFSDRPQALFELAHLQCSDKEWAPCREQARSFIKEFPNHELAPFAWRYVAAASSELATADPQSRQQLASDLEDLLKAGSFSPSEQADWTFILAKTRYELKAYEQAAQILQPLLSSDAPFAERANAELLIGLCHRDGKNDPMQFIQWAEQALLHKETLLPIEQVHVALFNAYLAKESIEQAAQHLYKAFELHAPIQLSNLLWLADYTYSRFEKDPAYAPAAAKLLSHFLERTDLNPNSLQAETIYLEPLFLKLAKLYSQIQKESDAIALLENLCTQYNNSPKLEWVCEKEVRLQLGEAYGRQGNSEQALQQFEKIVVASPTKRSRIAASATLQAVRIKLANSVPADLPKIAAQLKDLIIQKTLENEPLHLEAALDYIDLQTRSETPEKKLSLLVKTKYDLESQDDLLAKDYHAARSRLAEKNRIYLTYIQYLEAEIAMAEAVLSSNPARQKELQAKGKEILLQIAKEPLQTPLLDRIQRRLQSMNQNE